MAKGKSADASTEFGNRLPLDGELLSEKAAREAAAQAADGEQRFDGNGALIDDAYQELQDKLTSEGLTSGSLRLERKGPMDNGFAYICKMKVANFDIEMIKKMYGGGDYQVEFYRPDGKKAGRHSFTIDPRFMGAIELKPGKEDTNAGMNAALLSTIVQASKPDPMAGNLMQAMMKNSSDNMTLIMSMMMESSKTQMAMMTGMMQAMGQAMGAKNVTPSSGFDLKDIIPLLALMKPGEGSRGPSLLELAQTMRELKEIGSGEAAVAEPKGTLDKLLEALPHVASTVSALRGGPAQVVAAPPAGPVRAQVVAGTPVHRPVVIAPSPAAEKLATIQNGMLMLVKAAREGREVDLYHDMILELMDDGDLEMLKGALTQPTWFTTLFGQISDAPSFQPWMTRLRDALLETLNSSEPVAASPNGSSEHIADSSTPAGGPDPVVLQPGRDAGGAS